MIEAVSKGLTQKPAIIKPGTPVSPSRAFALWLALLCLYFFLLPSAAEPPSPAREIPAAQGPLVGPIPVDEPARARPGAS